MKINKSQIKSMITNINGKIYFNFNLSSLTWLKTGGQADVFFVPASLSDLKSFLVQLDVNIPIYLLGAGSNTLFRDNGFYGVVIKLDKKFDYINFINDNEVKVGAATNCIKLARILAKNGKAGLEFFSGIPGTVGGAIKMNAGAYGNETSEFLSKIKIIDRNGSVKEIPASKYKMNYRETKSNKN